MAGRRNVASRARWVEDAGEAEVLDSKGKLWLTTGVTRGGKLYYNVEEIGYATCSIKCCNHVA
jgi:tRNA-splicing endonuclease subunit Sen54